MTGGIILAAGVSSRMGSFKPMLKIGGTTFIKKMINQMKEAGAQKIIVVTGYRHEDLERHIKDEGVVCIYNDRFYCTQMLDSVKLALSNVPKECSEVLLSPVDVIVSPKWVFKAVMDNDADFVRPVYKGESGHPVLIRRKLFDAILNYEGDNGLRGAIEFSQCKVSDIDVNDPNILLDTDTKSDYLKALHEYDVLCGDIGKLHLDMELRLSENELLCDETYMQLIELIDTTGSLQNAATAMHMSYTKAWKMLKKVEEGSTCQLIVRESGGESGGGSYLTESGRDFLIRYKKMREEISKSSEKIFNKYFEDFRL